MSATIRVRFLVPTAPLLAAVWASAGPSANADDPWPATWPAAGPAELKILAALDGPTTMEFTDTPLRDVIDYLKDSHRIPIVIDNPALEEVGIGTDTPMTTNLKGVSFSQRSEALPRPPRAGVPRPRRNLAHHDRREG